MPLPATPAMTCATCHHENPAESRFCGGCGASLAVTPPCPACGHANPAGQRFCNGCGTSLAAAPPAPAPVAGIPEARPSLRRFTARATVAAGERKQVTVMFADVKGSMDLAEQLDPEEWSKIRQGFFAILSNGVERFEGFVGSIGTRSSAEPAPA